MNVKKLAKRGTPTVIRGIHALWTDTYNPASWGSSPSKIDVGILYPIDALKFTEAEDCARDLTKRGAKKVFLISWTDNKDFSWTDQFNPIHVIFDAEEERPEYHKRMLNTTSSASARTIPLSKLPEYARSTPDKYLVKISCRSQCNGKTRFAKLNKHYPGKYHLETADPGEYRATCLICGYEATDNYNWFRP